MQETSALYRRLLADENHWFEATVVVGEEGNLITELGEEILFGGTAIIVSRSGPDSGYTEEQIFSIRTDTKMFSSNPEVGQAIASEIEVVMLNPAGDMPRMSAIIPYVRVCTEEEQSEWIQQGVYFIDTREITNNDDGLNILTLHGFDAMLKAEQAYNTTGISWPALDTAIVSDIARIMGVTVDPRTWEIMTDNYTYPLPSSYSLREMLEYIAGSYVGSFIITETGQLRLVTLLELPVETSYLIDHIGDAITFGIDREGSEVTVSGGRIASFETEGVCDISELTATIVPKQDLHGYDAPWPAGGGKNKLPTILADIKTSNTTGAWSGNKYTLKGIEFTVNTDADGNVTDITANGTASANADIYIIGTGASGYVSAGITSGSYVFSGNPTSNSTAAMFIVRSGGTIDCNVYNTNEKPVTIDDATTYRIFIRINSGKQVSNAKFQPMVRLSTVSDATFAPYSNICPISGWTGATVSNTRNLISFEQGGITDATGSEAVNAGRIRSGYIPIEKIPKARNILTLLQADSVDIRKRYFYWYDANHTYIHEGNGQFNQAFPITLQRSAIPSGAKYLRIVLQNANNSLPVLPDGYNVSINPATASVTWQDEAGTVYGGTVDVVTGVLIADMGIKTELWKNFTSEKAVGSTLIRRQTSIASAQGSFANKERTISNIAPFDATIARETVHVSMASSGNYLYAILPTTTDPDLEITFCYPLATTQTYQLTPRQLNTFAENNIYVDTGSIEEVKYLIPTSEVTRILV